MPNNDKFEYGIGDDKKPYLIINGKAMKLDEDMEKLITFVATFRGLDDKEGMTDAQKAKYFFETMDHINNLVATVPGFTYDKDGNKVGVRAGKALFSDLVKNLPKKAKSNSTPFDTISYLNGLAEDARIDIGKAFYVEDRWLETANKYNELYEKMKNGEPIEYYPKDFTSYIYSLLRNKFSSSINTDKDNSEMSVLIHSGNRDHPNPRLTVDGKEVLLDPETQDLMNRVIDYTEGYFDTYSTLDDPERFEEMYELMGDVIGYVPIVSTSKDGQISVRSSSIGELVRPRQQFEEMRDDFIEFE